MDGRKERENNNEQRKRNKTRQEHKHTREGGNRTQVANYAHVRPKSPSPVAVVLSGQVSAHVPAVR